MMILKAQVQKCTMLKKITGLVLLGCSVVPSSFAFNMIDSLGIHHNKNKPQLALPAQKNKQNDHYTNFTGTWIGECTDSEETYDGVGVTIKNNAEFISFSESKEDIPERFKIGGYFSRSESNESGILDEHFLLNWISNGDVLSIDEFVVRRIENEPELTAISSKTTMSITNDQLIISGVETFARANDMPLNFSCKLTRADDTSKN